jgi:hypothetical protein
MALKLGTQLSLEARPSNTVLVEAASVCNPFLEEHYYLGTLAHAQLWLATFTEDELTQCQAWRWPTSRNLPADQSVLELSRWCIGPAARRNAGSWFNARAMRIIRQSFPTVTTLVSYSELGKHEGGLYRASNWEAWPTHHAERFLRDGVGYPSGHGSWNGVDVEAPKMRWRYDL